MLLEEQNIRGTGGMSSAIACEEHIGRGSNYLEPLAKDKAQRSLAYEELRIGPVPINGHLQLPLPGSTGNWLLHIFNNSGGFLQSVIPNAGVATLDLSSLSPGSYELIAVSALGTSVSGTVIKL